MTEVGKGRGTRSLSERPIPSLRPAAILLAFASLLMAGRAPAGERGLDGEIRRLVAAHVRAEQGLGEVQIAVAVVSDRGEMVASLAAREPLKPASNLKILTTAAALHHLGLDHRFETTLASTAPIKDGVIAGDLIVRGAGDPNISGRFHGARPEALFERWARRLRALGLRRIEGDLIADDTCFDDVRFPLSWDRRQEEAGYAAQVSALSLNNNCLDLTVRPGARAGLPAAVDAAPLSPAIRLQASVRTVARGQPHIIARRKSNTNHITIEGTIGAGSEPWSGNITIDDPTLFFAHSLAAVFAREGIAIPGQVKKKRRAAAEENGAGGDVPGGGARAARPERLLLHTSTLEQDLPIINKRSQNLHAELLLRALGARAGGEGSIEGGRRAVKSFLRAKGIPEDGLEVHDGSGLSHQNRASASLLAGVLHAARTEPSFAAFLASLPVAGEDGTLAERFESHPALRGRVFAKTGYIAGVSALSGYVERGSRLWAFSVLVNGLRGGGGGAKRLQEKIAAAVHEAMGGDGASSPRQER